MELRWEKDDFHDHVARPQCRQLCKAATDATKPPSRSRRYPSTDSGTIAEMDARSGPGLNDPFEEAIDDALSSLPADLRAAMSNVEIVVEDEPPDGQPLLGLYRGVPLPRRSSTYSGVLPDKISIFGGPISVCLRRVPTLAYDGPTPPANGQPVTVTVADGSCAQLPTPRQPRHRECRPAAAGISVACRSSRSDALRPHHVPLSGKLPLSGKPSP